MSFFENERVNSFFVTGGSGGRPRGGPRSPRHLGCAAAQGGLRHQWPPDSALVRSTDPGRLAASNGIEAAFSWRTRASEVARGGLLRAETGLSAMTVSTGPRRGSTGRALPGVSATTRAIDRRRIERIEVVRIRPQSHAGEDVAQLVEDPWRSFDCPANPAGCSIEFDDPDFAAAARDAVYYVRAIEAPSMAIHGSNPLGCSYDEAGRCISVSPCGVRVPKSEDCLSETRQRAWSSPILVDFDSTPLHR